MHADQNPFRSDRIEALRFRAAGLSVAVLITQLDRHDGRGSLIGPKGSGKTTLMEALATELTSRGGHVVMLRLSEEQRNVPWRKLKGLGPCSALLLDGAEQLPPPIWWSVRWRARRARYLVTTSHERPHLPLLLAHQTSVALLRQLVSELLGNQPLPQDLDEIFARHDGNIRSCLRELYDRASRQG